MGTRPEQWLSSVLSCHAANLEENDLGVGEQKVVWALLPPALLQTQAAHIPVDLGWYLLLVLCRFASGACN